MGSSALQQKMREVRVPFVRRCRLEFEDGRTGSAFLVNVNVNGAYIARDDLGRPKDFVQAPAADLPRLHEAVRCVFQLPGRDRDVVVDAVVSWVNPRQQHPVHGLPPGFGLSFQQMSKKDRDAITWLVNDYLARHPAAAR
ncbi:MAG TPA: PilZ domain-containing protein [Vicinamibacteria bacterium]|nr:PilZ domain-containing protein [Vicinamibacteria bacterium]